MVGGGNGEGAPPSTAVRPRSDLRPRATAESVFNGGDAAGYSPGPMTLLSSLFGDGDEYKSFSEFLAGAMMDPTPPRFFSDSPSQQQMLAQVTSHSNVQIQAEDPFSAAVPATSLTQVPTTISTTVSASGVTESFGFSHSDKKLHSSAVIVDKPNDDGYNWRKYGQKHVKGSDLSRSYYKCTHPNCPVKKKLERSLEGHVTAIIYKGEHNHQRKTTKGTLTSTENSDKLKEERSSHSVSQMDLESGTSDSEEVGDHETEMDEKNDEPDPKRRNTEGRLQDPASLHRTVAEPRIIVQTTSEVDLLDDGYRWRKYGQKVVKGNPYPRSYYKCTTPGCNVRKHVERASTDPKAVITTYEGKHNHDVPAAKTNSHTLANNSSTQLKAQNAMPDEKMHSFRGSEQRPVASLRLKEEKIT
ncbi:WRKY transcription factor 3 WRKY DNA-binding protein [Vigna angularis]|uniref:WRKY transcription factor 3 WRKY DNA-binding protein n=1 Tax=Phaseolus angularis TaxID=3914 RepID=A0A8T0LBH1_PHAAN|nr:WRKY transcription factor 3 WRKY DNA-binding protein [Vigna angularis]